MLSKDQSQKSSSSSEPKSGTTEVPLMSSDDSIDVAPDGDGTTNDPPATDHRPPSGYSDLAPLA